MKLFFFLATAIFLQATVNDPWRVELFSGYRNDHIHWHLQEPGDGGDLIVSEVFRNVEFLDTGLRCYVIHRDLSFFCQGSYSFLGRGNLELTSPETPLLNASSEGWAANVLGHVGYSVNLTDGRLYQVVLTPLIGYGGYFEELKARNSLSKLHLSLNGVFFGARFIYNSSGPFILQAGYAYHLLHDRTHSHFFIHPEGFPCSLKSSAGGNPGQSGWALLDFKLKHNWRFGFGANLRYFTTRVVDASFQQQGGEGGEKKLKLRWTSVSCDAHFSRTF